MVRSIHEQSIHNLNAIKYAFTYIYIFIASFQFERYGYKYANLKFIHIGFLLVILLIAFKIIDIVKQIEKEEEASIKINKFVRSFIIKKYESEYERLWKLKYPNGKLKLNNKLKRWQYSINNIKDTYLRIKIKPNQSYIVYKKYINNLKHKNCIICLEDISNENGILLGCNHYGHYTCFKKWFETEWNNKNSKEYPITCPICRQNIVNYYDTPKITTDSILGIMEINKED